MASTFQDFTLSAIAAPDDFIVGYDLAALDGERRWTVSTIANAVSGIMSPQLSNINNVNVVDSPTVDLSWNSSTRTLSADVKDASVTNAKIAFDGGSFAFKNKLINGNFDIWQRGTALTSASGARYLADRWTNGSTTTTYTAQSAVFTLGQTDVPNEPKHFHRTVVTSGNAAGCNATLHQHIEDVRTFAGKTVTLSFYAKTTTAPESVAIEFYQNFGTGGSPSAAVSIPAGKFALTTSWQKFTVTASIPSITDKTIGTDGNDSLTVYFWFDAGSNFASRASSIGYQSGTFDIALVQLEEGSIATPFEQRHIGTELSLCQRYYEKSYPINIAPGAANEYRGTEYEIQAVYTTNAFAGGVLLRPSFKQTKRTSAPTITVYNPNNGTANQISIWSNGSTFDRNVGISTPNVDHKRALIWPIAGTTVNSGYICIGHWAVDAEL